MTNSELIQKCIKFYTDNLTRNRDGSERCPTIDEMREIVQLDDITKSLDKKAQKE